MISTILGEEVQFMVSSRRKLRTDQWKLISAVMTLPILFAIIASETMGLPSSIPLFLGFFGVILAGAKMFQEAIASIQNGILGFQVLTSLAVVGASVLGEWIEALTVVALVSFASHLEDRAITRARESMQGGLDRIPRSARIVNQVTGVIYPINLSIPQIPSHHSVINDSQKTPIEAVLVGDLVEVRSGEVIPVDGTITKGSGSIDKAPLTGEPVPIPVSEGDKVQAGLVLVRGPIVVSSEATGENTRLSGLIEMVRQYREKPTRTQTIIENFTRLWVPLVLLGAPSWFPGSWMVGAGFLDNPIALGCIVPLLSSTGIPDSPCAVILCLVLWRYC